MNKSGGNIVVLQNKLFLQHKGFCVARMQLKKFDFEYAELKGRKWGNTYSIR